MPTRMRAPFGNAVAEVADESVEAFTAAGWTAESGDAKSTKKSRSKSE